MQWFKNMKRQLKVQNTLREHESLSMSNWARIECLGDNGKDGDGVTSDNPLQWEHFLSPAGLGNDSYKNSFEKRKKGHYG